MTAMACASLAWSVLFYASGRYVYGAMRGVQALAQGTRPSKALQDATYRRWVFWLKVLCRVYVQPLEFVSRFTYARFSPILVYRVKSRGGQRVAQPHLRSWPPSALAELFTPSRALGDFVSLCGEVLGSGRADAVVATTNGRLFSRRALETRIVPGLRELGLDVSRAEGSDHYLPWMYAEYLLIYGMGFYETERGVRVVGRLREVVELTVRRRALE